MKLMNVLVGATIILATVVQMGCARNPFDTIVYSFGNNIKKEINAAPLSDVELYRYRKCLYGLSVTDGSVKIKYTFATAFDFMVYLNGNVKKCMFYFSDEGAQIGVSGRELWVLNNNGDLATKVPFDAPIMPLYVNGKIYVSSKMQNSKGNYDLRVYEEGTHKLLKTIDTIPETVYPTLARYCNGYVYYPADMVYATTNFILRLDTANDTCVVMRSNVPSGSFQVDAYDTNYYIMKFDSNVIHVYNTDTGALTDTISLTPYLPAGTNAHTGLFGKVGNEIMIFSYESGKNTYEYLTFFNKDTHAYTRTLNLSSVKAPAWPRRITNDMIFMWDGSVYKYSTGALLRDIPW